MASNAGERILDAARVRLPVIQTSPSVRFSFTKKAKQGFVYPSAPAQSKDTKAELSFLENTQAAFNYVSSAIGTAGVRVPTRKAMHCLVPYMYSSQLLLIRAAYAMYNLAREVPSLTAANGGGGAAAGGGGPMPTATATFSSAIKQACTNVATEPNMEVKPGTGHWLRAILDYGVPWGGLLWGNFEPETDVRAWKNTFSLPANTIDCLTHQTIVVMTRDARTLTKLIAAATLSAVDARRSTFWIDGIDWNERDIARSIKLVLLLPLTASTAPIVAVSNATVTWANHHTQTAIPFSPVVKSKGVMYPNFPPYIFEFDVLFDVPSPDASIGHFCREVSATVQISSSREAQLYEHTFVWKTLGCETENFVHFSAMAETKLPYIKPHMVAIDASMRTWLSGDIWLFADGVIEDARVHAKRDFGGDDFGINRVATLLAWKATTVIARPFSRTRGYLEASLDTSVARDAIDPISQTTWDSLVVREDLVNEAMRRLVNVPTQAEIRSTQEKIKTMACLMDSAGWPFGLSLIHTSLYGAFEPLPRTSRLASADEYDSVFLAYAKLVAAVQSDELPQPRGLVDFAIDELTHFDIAVILCLNGTNAAVERTESQKDELKLFVQRMQQTLIVESYVARELTSSRLQRMDLGVPALWPRRPLMAGEVQCDGLIARIDAHLLFSVFRETEGEAADLDSFWLAGATAATLFRTHVQASIEKRGGLNPDSVPQVFRMLLQRALFQASSTEANFMVLGVSTPSHAAALVLVSRILTSSAYSNAFEWKANFNGSTNGWEIKNKVAVVIQFAHLFLIPRVAPPAGTERVRFLALRDRLSDAISRADAWYSGKARAADDPSAAAHHWQQLASNIFWSPPATAIPPHAAGPTGNGSVHWLASGWSQPAGHYPRTQSKNGITLHIRNLSVLGLWIGILALVLKIDEQGEFVESTFAELPIIREYSTSATPKEKRAALRRLAKDALLHVGSTPTGAAAAAAGEDSEATARVFNIMPAWGYGQ